MMLSFHESTEPQGVICSVTSSFDALEKKTWFRGAKYAPQLNQNHHEPLT